MADTQCPPRPPSIVPRGWRPSFPPDADGGESSPRPGFTHTCQALAEKGDVLGVLTLMRSRPAEVWPMDIMDHLAKAIRKLAKNDLAALIDVALGEIIGLATVLAVRCQLHVEQRLMVSAPV